MNKNIIKEKWEEIKGKLQERWEILTDTEVAQMEGNYDELESVLQKKYGYERDQAACEIEEFLEENGWNEGG